MAGTWQTIVNAPPASVATTFLLPDGSVLAQQQSDKHWYRLTPDASGDYHNGTWSQVADSTNGPLYYASGILRDGRLIVAGGEYNFGAKVWLCAAEMYDYVADTWTTLPTPTGWTKIGDAPGCVLPDGRFFLGQLSTQKTAIYDPNTNTWTAAADKVSRVGEEGWSLMPDGTISSVDCYNGKKAEKYVIAANTWVAASETVDTLVDSIHEIGPAILLPDGRLFVVGATGFTALYTMPAWVLDPGTWAQGPSIPEVNVGEALGVVDGPGCVLPNGKALIVAGPITTPATFKAPTYFFEFDPTSDSFDQVPSPANATKEPYTGRMMVLPTGQVLFTNGTKTVTLYTPDGTPDPTWKPNITSAPVTVVRGTSFTLHGRQLNGVTQCVYYGNDATQATNYPIVRLEQGTSVYYCRTRDYSTMNVQTGSVVHTCKVTVPSTVPVGTYCMRVIVNGISSDCRRVHVTKKAKPFKELKAEVKEKNEIIEVNKRLLDVAEKRLPDVVDPKLIREEFEQFGRIQEDWLDDVRTWAAQVDEAEQVRVRSFVTPEERPDLGVPKPLVEALRPKKISKAEGLTGAQKRAYNDGREELAMSREANAFHLKVHGFEDEPPPTRRRSRR